MPQFAAPLPNDSSRMKKVLIIAAAVAVVLVILVAWMLRKNSPSVSDDMPAPQKDPSATEVKAPSPDEIQQQLDKLNETQTEAAEKVVPPTTKEIEKQLEALEAGPPKTEAAPPAAAPSPAEIQQQLDALSNTK